MNDYISLLPVTLAWIASWLDGVSPVPWPLWIGGLFPIYLAVLSIVLWFMRGWVWPVRCAYPVTKRKRDCQMVVAGEWRRCRHHHQLRGYRFGHTVDTRIRRWERVNRSGRIVDRGSRGAGLVRLRPGGDTLLYCRGYTRRPGDVPRVLLDAVRQIRDTGRSAWRWFRGTAQPDLDDGDADVPAGDLEVAAGLTTVVQATRFALVTFGAGILFAIVAVPFTGLVQTVLQYLSTLALVLAWAATSAGFYRRDEAWLSASVLKALKWWALIFIPVAVLNLVFAATGSGLT